MKIVGVNKKARFEYHILETFEAGISLVGTEVKALRQNSVSLVDAYCKVEGYEIFLMEANISQYSHGNVWNHEPKRKRKLLMHKREILRINQKVKEKGLTIIPIKIYFTNKGIAKVEIALAKGKKLYDKRETIAKRDMDRRMKQREDY